MQLHQREADAWGPLSGFRLEGSELTKQQKFEFASGISLISTELFFDFSVDAFLFPSLIRLATLHGHALGDGPP